MTISFQLLLQDLKLSGSMLVNTFTRKVLQRKKFTSSYRGVLGSSFLKRKTLFMFNFKKKNMWVISIISPQKQKEEGCLQ